MKWFRNKLAENRIFILTLVAVNFFFMVDGRNFIYAYQVHEEDEKRLEEISALLDIPVEKLRPDHEPLFDSLKTLFVKDKDPVQGAALKRLQEALRAHEAQLASNPFSGHIEDVKREHAIHRIEGLIGDLMQLTTPRAGEALPEGSQRAQLLKLHGHLQERLELPPLPEGLPAEAYARQGALQEKLDRLFDSVRPVLADAQAKRMSGLLAQKIGQLQLQQAVDVKSTVRGPRFADRPLPLHYVERKARTEEVPAGKDFKDLKASSAISGDTSPARVPTKMGIAPEIVDLAASLDNSPAKIFRFVYDTIDLDPKWGADKSPLGTLQENNGTSWDQAWLLKELLTAAGVDARFEWGEVLITADMLKNIAGIDDAFGAGNYLTTAGLPIVLLTQGSQVIAARMSHVWIRAFIDNIPNRGVTAGPGDTWVRMDPSLKGFDVAAGILIHDQVPFSLGGYLQSGTPLAPRRFFEDALWDYIRANNVNCTDLEQLKRAKKISRTGFPFVPGTLRAQILSVDNESETVPEAFQQRLALQIRQAVTGTLLLTWSTPWSAVYGRRLEMAWPGATAADQTILDESGGVFQTPPFLVDLRPSIRVDGVEVATGGAVGSAQDVEIVATVTQVNGPPTVVDFEILAGERNVIALDFARQPQQLIDAQAAAAAAAAAAGDLSESEAWTLALIGSLYMRILSRDLDELADLKWQRLVKLGTIGMVLQRGTAVTTVDGTPLSFTQGPTTVDIASMPLGVFPADGRDGFLVETFELLGSQSSFLEGEALSQTIEDEAMTAVTFLTRAVREGQALTFVTQANLDAALAAAELGAGVEAEIRTGVQQGKVAWIAETELTINQWRGSGYIIEDPQTGAAGYLGTGGFGIADSTGRAGDNLSETLGGESWHTTGIFGQIMKTIFGSPRGGDSTDSDPINISNGNMWHKETDLGIATRGVPIKWTRTYNSRSDRVGPMGYGWSFTYGESLEVEGDGTVIYHEADGTEHIFTPDGAGGFIRPGGKYFTLTPTAAGFQMRRKEGGVRSFDTAGRLSALADANGNSVSLTRDAAGNLTTVIDAAGRTAITVTTTDGLVTAIEDLAGNRVTFGYDGDDLVSVTDPVGETWAFSYDSRHNMIARGDPNGASHTFGYDALDRCISHTDPLGNGETIAYSDRGRRAVVTDARGFTRFVEFDERGRNILDVDALGNVTRSEWDDDNNRVANTDARGGVTSRTYDDNGNMLTRTDPADQVTSFTYDPEFSMVLTETDAAGHTRIHGYDADGNRIRTTEVVDGETRIEERFYDEFGQLTRILDPTGDETLLSWDSATGNLESHTDIVGEATSVVLDDLGRPSRLTDPEGHEMTFDWDGKNRLLELVDYSGDTWNLDYDPAGRYTELSGPRGTDRFTYDDAGRMILNTDRQGNTRRLEYDVTGNIVAEIDVLGNRTATTYDALGRQIAKIDPLGQVWSFEYCNELGIGSGTIGASPCGITDPLGNTTKRHHDPLGRVTEVIDPLGNVTAIEYDARDRKTAVIDALERIMRFEYDGRGNPTAVVDGNGARTEYTYDRRDNLIEILDAEQRTWTKTYDARDQLLSETDPLGNTTSWTYNGVGKVASKRTANGDLITFDYDVGQLMAVNLPGGDVESFTYDAFGNRAGMTNGEVSISFVYDNLLRLQETVNHTLDKTTRFTYDAAGRRTRMVSPESTVDFVYDALGRLVEQRDSAVGTYRFEYDAAGRRTQLAYPNGLATETTYDDAGRVESVLTRNALRDIVDGYSYTYDSVGNRLSMAALHQGGEANTYTYDEVDRLVRWERGASRFEEYSYDLVGNRLDLTDQSGSVSYTYDDADRLLEEIRTFTGGGSTTTAYAWDDNGNLLEKNVNSVTTSYVWDTLDRLVQVDGSGGLSTYGYDSDGIRVRETGPDGTRRFLYADEDILAIYDESGDRTGYFSHGPGFDEPLAQVVATDVHYLHRDALGSVTALSSTAGEVGGRVTYAAFGGVDARSGAESIYGYTSRELDPTGQMYYRARYYDPGTSRFQSKDPAVPDPTVPASFHEYSYVRNNPITRVDPLGLADGADNLATMIGKFVIVISQLVKLWVFEIAFHSMGGTSHAWAMVLAFIGLLVAWELYNLDLIPWWVLALEIILLGLAVLALVHWPHGWLACRLLYFGTILLLIWAIASSIKKIGKLFDKSRGQLQEDMHGEKYDLLNSSDYD